MIGVHSGLGCTRKFFATPACTENLGVLVSQYLVVNISKRGELVINTIVEIDHSGVLVTAEAI